MSEMDEREQGFEAKFRLEQEITFKVEVRLARLMGLWAAGRMGLAGTAADSYAGALRDALTAHGEKEIFEKISADFTAAGIAVSLSELTSELERSRSRAREQVTKELADGTQSLTPGL